MVGIRQIGQSDQIVGKVWLGKCRPHSVDQGTRSKASFHMVVDYVHQIQSCFLLRSHFGKQGRFEYPGIKTKKMNHACI